MPGSEARSEARSEAAHRAGHVDRLDWRVDRDLAVRVGDDGESSSLHHCIIASNRGTSIKGRRTCGAGRRAWLPLVGRRLPGRAGCQCLLPTLARSGPCQDSDRPGH
jgi:hypothetical protein